MNAPLPRPAFNKSEAARALWASGVRDKREIMQRTGISASSLWWALKRLPEQTIEEPGGPTYAERQRAMALATMRGDVQDRADAIAAEIARARNTAQKAGAR